MKVDYAESGRTQESQGIQRTKAYQIKANNHAFQILSSGLYSDKIAAVLREIGCNAHDAHLEAKQPKPFLVKLPTRLDNQFYIRDWGVGLDADEVENLYTTYFESSKQHSNEFTGAFGLGSKSPFSYVDTYTVTAAKNGAKRVYTLHIDESGTPVVSLMWEGESEPDWPNGVQVGFPVRPDDFERFRDRAFKIFRWFKPFPDIVGGVQLTQPKFTEDQGDYAFFHPDTASELGGNTHLNYYQRHSVGDNNWVQMGNVIYPLKLENLAKVQGINAALIEAAKTISNMLVRVPIGAVQVAASREELQYNDATKDKLAAIVAQIPKRALQGIIAESRAVNSWDKLMNFRAKARSMVSNIQLSAQVLEAAGATKAEAENIMMPILYGDALKLPVWNKDDKAKVKYLKQSGRRDFSLTLTEPHYSKEQFFHPSKEMKIVVGDTKNPYGRTRLAIKTGKLKDCVLIYPAKDAPDSYTKEALKLLQDRFFDVPTVYTSSLDKPATVKKAAKRASEKVLVDGKEMLLDDVPDDRKVYVKVQRRSAWGNPRVTYITKTGETLRHWEVYTVESEFGQLEALVGEIPKPVYFNERQIKRYGLEADADWKEWTDYIKERLESKDTKDRIDAVLKNNKITVDLTGRPEYVNDLVSILVHFAHSKPNDFNALKPVLQKHGILADIEQLLKDSQAVAKGHKVYGQQEIQSMFHRFQSLCTRFNAQVAIPQTKKATAINIVARFKHANKINWTMFSGLANLDISSLIHLLDTQFTKG